MILRNAMVRWLALVTNLAVGLATTPLMLKHLGKTAYGVWLVCMSLTGMANFLDLGLATAVTKNVAADLARGDRQGAWAAANNCLTMYGAIALVVAVVFVVVSWQAETLLNLGPEMARPGSLALLVLGMSTALSFPATLFEGMLLAREQHHLVGSVEATVAVLRLGALYIALTNRGGLLAVSVAHSGATILGFVALYLISLRRVPMPHAVRPRWEWARAKGLMAYGRDTLMINLGLRVRQEGPVLLTNALGGPGAVPPLGVGLRLISYQVSLVTAAAGATMPRFAALEVSGDKNASHELLLRSTLYTGLLVVLMGMAAWFLVEHFVDLWLGQDFSDVATVVRIIMVPMGLYLALRPCEAFLYGVGRHRNNGLLYLGEGVFILGLCLYSLPRWGALGAAGSIAVTLLLARPWFLPIYSCRLAQLSPARFYLQGLGRPALVALAAGVPLWFLFQRWMIRSWMELLPAALTVFVVVGLAIWFIGLNRAEHEFWLEKLKPLAARLGGGKVGR